MQDDIAELHQQGIEVDNDNEPAPENAGEQPAINVSNLEWLKPTICPRRAASNVIDNVGMWRYHPWNVVAEMTELQLFQLAFPEQYIKDHLIPATNTKITHKITLSEFYIWLGCNFFMACFKGMANQEDWWSKSDIDMRKGSPF